MNEIVPVNESRGLTDTLSAADIRARVNRIQEVMKAVMIKDVHYGTIPGTQKPTLYKPGAEVILVTFRIAAGDPTIEDLSTDDEVRYRVKVPGYHGNNLVGVGVGECSSSEEKYKWRKPVCDPEFDETEAHRRREKWMKDGKKFKQIRTNPSDVANTVLKMAHKRALIAMTLVTTAASDVFSQDLEDLPEEIRDAVVSEEQPKAPPVKPPQKKAEANGQAKEEWRSMSAKYEGVCDYCNNGTAVGDRIHWLVGTKTVRHESCMQDAQDAE